MKHIEFLGLPGSGKSTLRSKAAQALSGSHGALSSDEAVLNALRRGSEDRLVRLALRLLPASLARKKFGFIFTRSTARTSALNRFLAGRQGLLAAVESSAAFSLLPEGERGQALSNLFWTCAFYQLSDEACPGNVPVLFDEGFAQRTVNLFTSPTRGVDPGAGDDAVSYLAKAPGAQIVIWVEGAPELCARRLFRRPEGPPLRTLGLSEQELASYLGACAPLLERVRAWCGENGSRVLTVENSGPFEDSAAALAGELHELLKTSGPRHDASRRP